MLKSVGALARIFGHFSRDQRGAALVEYSVIIGIMLVLALAAIGAVGVWIVGQWTTALGLLRL